MTLDDLVLDDLVLDGLLVDLHVAHSRIADLEVDVATYRELSITAIHQLHRLTLTIDRLRESNRHLREEQRQERRDHERGLAA